MSLVPARRLSDWSVSCRFGWAAAVVLALQFAVAVWAFFYGGEFLSEPATDPLPADCIVILGGNPALARLEAGAELYRDGYAPRVLVTGFAEGDDAAERWDQEWRIGFLTFLGVPREQLIPDQTARSSWMEIELLRRMMVESRWRRVLVVSDPPHMRRLSLVVAKTFAGTGLEVRLIASHPDWWNAEHWWANSVAGSFVLMEFIKLGYYALGDRL